MKRLKVAILSSVFTILIVSALFNIQYNRDPLFGLRNINDLQIKEASSNAFTPSTVINQSFSGLKQENIDVGVIFCNGSTNPVLQSKLQYAFKSLLDHSSLGLTIHVIGDSDSTNVAGDIIKNLTEYRTEKDKVVYHDAAPMLALENSLIKTMQLRFSSSNSYYSSGLFFLSLCLYKYMPMKTMILFDIDVKFESDVKHLQDYFISFDKAHFGLAPELSPVYFHILHQYRKTYPNSTYGLPIKSGFPGFNSGLILMHLENLRNHSDSFDKLKSETHIVHLVEKYGFKGHLGDQDFYTLLYFEDPTLFKVLPCGWNRQLCKWWKSAGYKDVFDNYYNCDEPVKMYHANCNAEFPYS